MGNHGARKIIVLLLFIVFTFCIVYSDVQTSVNVRVGLFYEKNAINSFIISSAKGFDLGYQEDSGFVILLSENTSNIVTIRKDDYYSVKDNNLILDKPNDPLFASEPTIGPYHIMIGESYKSKNDAEKLISILNTFDIHSYLVFNDAWQVWTGNYLSYNEANNIIINDISNKVSDLNLKVIEPSSKRIIITDKSNKTVFVYDNIRKGLQIKSSNTDNFLVINKTKAYRGLLEIQRRVGSDMTVINILPIEEYLYGVVTAEMGRNTPLEAFKAQAVISRTYTLNMMNRHQNYGFDLCDSEHCHAYKGVNDECLDAIKAVDETASLKVMSNDKPANVYYSSSNGGWTESPNNVWNPNSKYPYLITSEDKYDPIIKWNVTFTHEIISKMIMTTFNKDIGTLLNINIKKTSNSGRITELELVGTKDFFTLLTESTRTAFGLKSQLYTINTDSDVYVLDNNSNSYKTQMINKHILASNNKIKITSSNTDIYILDGKGNKRTINTTPKIYNFDGKGYGHGIGMSQMGAKKMAEQGLTYDQIIKFYFSGTTIK